MRQRNSLADSQGSAAHAEDAQLPPLKYPLPDTLEDPGDFGHPTGFNAAVDRRLAAGGFGEGFAAAWFRYQRPFVAGQANSPIMCAAASGDYSNGIGSKLDFEKWTFINADLTLHFAREPVGDWILLEATNDYGADGASLGHGQLSDERGAFGRAIQSLVIAKR